MLTPRAFLRAGGDRLREQLTKDEVEAASNAAVAALPKVDAAAAKQCETAHKPALAAGAKADELAAAALCDRVRPIVVPPKSTPPARDQIVKKPSSE